MGLLFFVYIVNVSAKEPEDLLAIENATSVPYTVSIYPAHKGAPHPIHYPIAELNMSILSNETLAHRTNHSGQVLVLVQRTNVPYGESMPFLFTVQQPGTYMLRLDKMGNLLLDPKTATSAIVTGIKV